jgi:hypothetical protein
VPEFLHYPGEHLTRIETYERSRQRNDDHNVSASASLARARGSVGNGGMADTPCKKVKDKLVKRIAWTSCRCASRENVAIDREATPTRYRA